MISIIRSPIDLILSLPGPQSLAFSDQLFFPLMGEAFEFYFPAHGAALGRVLLAIDQANGTFGTGIS